jgi:hypothetical protein
MSESVRSFERELRVVTAVNLSTHASRTTKQELPARFIPELLSTARSIDERFPSQLS